jgi:multidrug efflux pump subunit AcrA (membrane-fusion protein)
MRVLLPLAIAGSLLLGIGLGRHSRGPENPAAESSSDVAETPGTIPLSEEQLRRSGLSMVRPEASTGTERPISGFVEAAVGSRSSVGMPVAGRVVRLLVAAGTAVRAGEPIAEVQSACAAVVRAQPVDASMPPAGTAVTAFVQMPASEQRLTVPADAIQLVDGSTVVFRYLRGAVERVPVVVGQQSAGRTEILQGVRSSDLVLSGNTTMLRRILAGGGRSIQEP